MIAALTLYESKSTWTTNRRGSVRRRADVPFSASNIQFHHVETVDSWIRDYGPNFLIGSNGQLAFNELDLQCLG